MAIMIYLKEKKSSLNNKKQFRVIEHSLTISEKVKKKINMETFIGEIIVYVVHRS